MLTSWVNFYEIRLQFTVLTALFFLKPVQCQPGLNQDIQPIVVEGFFSIIINPFLRVFAVKVFLKVIHTPDFFFQNFSKKKILRIFITWTRNPWHGGVYIPYGKSWLRGFEKIYVGRLFSGYLKLGVLGAWMTFKKAEMAKTLRNGLSMIETNTLNHKWLDFAI